MGLFVWGAGGGHNWVIATADIQASTPDHLLGRVTSLDFFLFSVGGSLAALGSGFLCDVWEDPTAGTWVSLAIGGLLWLYCLVLNRREPTALCDEVGLEG